MRNRVFACLGVVAALTLTGPAPAQISSDSFWPKFQRDARNSGVVPTLGFVRDLHVAWWVEVYSPAITPGERHAMPVFSPDNTRLYIGGPNSTLTAVDIETHAVLWTVALGAGAGTIHQTPVVRSDGALFVGAWNGAAPYDGFSKITDDGDVATVHWTFPLRGIASPTITADGQIVVAGQHETLGWGVYAIDDLGDTCTLAWAAAQLSDPNDPASTGWIGSSPAFSPDAAWLFAGSYQNHTFWQIDAATGADATHTPLDYYCYAPSAVVSDEGLVLIGEGMSSSAPDDETQGKLYLFEPDETGVVTLLESLPLAAGHLNGGTGAIWRRPDGALRLYVPANGYRKAQAQLIAVEIDPTLPQSGEPALSVKWEVSIGSSARTYPQAVVTLDSTIYTLGPRNHTLYALRDMGASGANNWTVALTHITRTTGWTLDQQTGPAGVIVGPDGTVYWQAIDGFLYALRGWFAGDLDGDDSVTSADLSLLEAAVADADDFALRFPEVDFDRVADINADGSVDTLDVDRLSELLSVP